MRIQSRKECSPGESKRLLLLELIMKNNKPFEDDICIPRGKYNKLVQLLHEVLPSREVNSSVWQWSFPQMSSENDLSMITIYSTKLRNRHCFILWISPRCRQNNTLNSRKVIYPFNSQKWSRYNSYEQKQDIFKQARDEHKETHQFYRIFPDESRYIYSPNSDEK